MAKWLLLQLPVSSWITCRTIGCATVEKHIPAHTMRLFCAQKIQSAAAINPKCSPMNPITIKVIQEKHQITKTIKWCLTSVKCFPLATKATQAQPPTAIYNTHPSTLCNTITRRSTTGYTKTSQTLIKTTMKNNLWRMKAETWPNIKNLSSLNERQWEVIERYYERPWSILRTTLWHKLKFL